MILIKKGEYIMSNIVSVKNLNKSFKIGKEDNLILKNLSFDIQSGEFVSIMGPSGCGKSTLLYLLGGLDEPTSGSVSILGKDISSMKINDMCIMRRRNLGFIFQFYNLVPNLNVEDNILLPILLDGKKSREYKSKLKELLAIIGMEDKIRHTPHELSGGQQQRVAIARALLYNPELILADEPIGNLDSKSGIEVMELFKKINKEYGTTIIQVTHSEESALYGTRIIRMKDGVIVG